jgi:CBS domain containing-hemolysin-like protein
VNINFGIILITLSFSVFFSGIEIAFVSSNKLRIELDKKQKKFPSGIISLFTKNQGQFLATTFVGNNIAFVLYGIFMAIMLQPKIMIITESETVLLLIEIIVSTIIIVITGQFITKTIFGINPNSALNIFAIPILFFYFIFYPVSKFSIFISNVLTRKILRIKVDKNYQSNFVFGKINLENFVNESPKDIIVKNELEQEIKIFQNALDFSNVKLRECIVPRNELVAVELETSIEELRKKFTESGFSKILIYKESIDNIIGYVHLLELFKSPLSIASILSDLLIVPESMSANKLLDMLINEHKSIALVVDEFGGTAGIATIEDIMEEIFGEIEDEHDKIEYEEKQLSDNEFLFSGRIEIDYINEKYNLGIQVSSDYETIAGFILFHHETIPDVMDEIEIDIYKFIIEKVDKPRIETVRLVINV